METKPHSGHSDMVGPFLDAVKARRTYYSLTNESTIPDSEIISIAKEVIKHTPSSLNSQSTRFVIVLGDQHRRLWDIAKDCVKAIDSAEDWSYDEKNMSNRQAAYGTVLLYEDQEAIQGLRQNFPRFDSYFGQWSEHTNAMNTFNLWTALEAAGLGCNLGHYNPWIDQRVGAEFKVPVTWRLTSQLVFGKPVAPPKADKTFQPVEDRVLVRGAQA